MIRRIAYKEFTEIRRDGRFKWVAGSLFVLLSVSLFTGWQRYAAVSAENEAARSYERQRWIGQGEKHPHTAAHYGVYAFAPQMPLSAVDEGLNSYTGTTIFLEAHYQNLSMNRPAENATALDQLGKAAPAVTLQLLIPLLIILFLYPAFAGERESGTLRQVLSVGVSRRELALGKTLGTMFELFVFLAPLALIGTAAMFLYTTTEISIATLPRILLMTAAYLLFFAAVAAVSLIVSAGASSSRISLLILLSFWFVGSFMLPPLLTDAAKAVYPIPNGFEFEAALEQASKSKPPLLETQIAVDKKLMEQYGVDSVEELPVNASGVALMEDEEIGTRLREVHFNELYDSHAKQNRFYQIGSIFAPLLAVQSLSMGLAGTDFYHHRHFAEAAEKYRRDFVQRLNRDDAEHGDRWIPGTMMKYKANQALWESVDPFEYEPARLLWTLSQHIFSIAVLLGWFVVAFAALPLALARMRID